jgi:hypothetical protein
MLVILNVISYFNIDRHLSFVVEYITDTTQSTSALDLTTTAMGTSESVPPTGLLNL